MDRHMKFGLAITSMAVASLVTVPVAAASPTATAVTWSRAHPAKSPPARYGAAMAAAGSTIVLFGGQGSTQSDVLGDTWTWSKGAWKHETGAVHPPPLAAAAMAYDPIIGKVVLFGGKEKSGTTSGATWLWTGGKWTKRKTKVAPAPRVAAEMAYSPANKGLLLFSGLPSINSPSASRDTWLFTSTGWKKLTPKTSPPGSFFGTMCPDTAVNHVVLFTGYESFTSNTAPGETWVWNGSNWRRLTPLVHPSSRLGESSAYDPARKAVVLFGGGMSKVLSDTWAWSGTSWSKLAEKTAPSARAEQAMAYDASSNKLLIFGGTNVVSSRTFPVSSDTWLGTP